MDARPPLSAILTAFGVPAVVRVSGEEPVVTVVVWTPTDSDDYPGDGRFSRREPRKVMAVSRAAVPILPAGSLVEAPELLGGESRTWRVDGFDRQEPDLTRVIVVDVTEEP